MPVAVESEYSTMTGQLYEVESLAAVSNDTTMLETEWAEETERSSHHHEKR